MAGLRQWGRQSLHSMMTPVKSNALRPTTGKTLYTGEDDNHYGVGQAERRTTRVNITPETGSDTSEDDKLALNFPAAHQ